MTVSPIGSSRQARPDLVAAARLGVKARKDMTIDGVSAKSFFLRVLLSIGITAAVGFAGFAASVGCPERSNRRGGVDRPPPWPG